MTQFLTRSHFTMRQWRAFFSLLLVCGSLTACGDVGEREDLTSPCVGLEGSPCGPRRAVNDWWLT
jgi:hypothetical protein